MAILHPSYDRILKSKPKPTEGELTVLNFLLNSLNDQYEVFFQPFLNGDLPDIIIMRKGGGVLIIEVKDWDLKNFYVDKKGRWRVKSNDAFYNKSPLQQVLQYKRNFYDLHIEGLLDLHLKDYKFWFVVSCAVYFHCHPTAFCQNFINGIDTEPKYKSFIEKNFSIIGNDGLNESNLKELLYKTWISRSSYYFTESLYNSFKRYLQPPLHKMEDGIEINYTEKQKELIISIKGARKRIKGAAGSGKTLVLAKRAVNAHKRTNDKVLILTYNITLRNYVRDKISQIREKFDWLYFNISNYHDFIKSQFNNIGVQLEVPEDFDNYSESKKEEYFEDTYFSNLDLFLHKKELLPKYEAILIDETQDYKEKWIRIIDKCFLEDEGEIVVFGDEKQNIYSRDLETNNKMPIIPIQVGAWDNLKESHRLCKKIADLATEFQQAFFYKKYEIEKVAISSQKTIFDEIERNIERIEYKYFDRTLDETLAAYIFDRIKKLNIHSNDVCILSSRIKMLREIDLKIKTLHHENTTVMFESEEIYQTLSSKYNGTSLKREIEKVRKNKKINFWMNGGTVKLSTIHSFKGWEIHTLFLVIENNLGVDEELHQINQAFNPSIFSDELVYTGITRCRYNLIILNVGNVSYHNFFATNKNVDEKS